MVGDCIFICVVWVRFFFLRLGLGQLCEEQSVCMLSQFCRGTRRQSLWISGELEVTSLVFCDVNFRGLEFIIIIFSIFFWVFVSLSFGFFVFTLGNCRYVVFLVFVCEYVFLFIVYCRTCWFLLVLDGIGFGRKVVFGFDLEMEGRRMQGKIDFFFFDVVGW